MLVHKSGLLLFEKWKKMSQISVLIMLSRWQQAFMCWGSVPAVLLLYVNSDSRLIVMESTEEQSEKYCAEDGKKGRKTGCMRIQDIQAWILWKRNKEIASPWIHLLQINRDFWQVLFWDSTQQIKMHLLRFLFIFKAPFEKYVCLVKQYGDYSGRIDYTGIYENLPVSPWVPETFSKRVTVDL